MKRVDPSSKKTPYPSLIQLHQRNCAQCKIIRAFYFYGSNYVGIRLEYSDQYICFKERQRVQPCHAFALISFSVAWRLLPKETVSLPLEELILKYHFPSGPSPLLRDIQVTLLFCQLSQVRYALSCWTCKLTRTSTGPLNRQAIARAPRLTRSE